MKKTLLSLVFLALIQNLSFSQFSGLFDPSNWTFASNTNTFGGDGSINTSGAPTSIELSGSDANSGYCCDGNEQYYITIPTTGTIRFDYTHLNPDGDDFYYLLDGAQTFVSSGGSGTVTVPVTAGQVFAFQVYNVDDCCGRGVATISNFALICGTMDGGNDQNLCDGDQATLTATTSFSSFSWNNSITDGVAFTPSTGTTNYIVSGYDPSTACFNADTVVITTNTIPTVDNPTNVVSCGDYTLPTLTNGNYYTGTGATGSMLSAGNIISSSQTLYVHASNAGCENESNFTITIQTPATGTDTRTECNSLTWIDGNTYTSNNNTATHNIVGGAANGCDSLVTLDLTIVNPTTGTDTRTECASYTWIDGNTYTTDNNTATYNIVGGAANGCDSLVTLDLTINNVSDITITTNGFTITANNTNATYQWVDCNDNYTPLAGETSQSFTPSANGNYAVIVTENNCTDTSACESIVGLSVEKNSLDVVKVYPNPTTGMVQLDMGSVNETFSYTVVSADGKLIVSKNNMNKEVIMLNLSNNANGIYMVTIQTQSDTKTIRIVKN